MRFLYGVSPLLTVMLAQLTALAQRDKRPDPVHWREYFCLSLSDEVDDTGFYLN